MARSEPGYGRVSGPENSGAAFPFVFSQSGNFSTASFSQLADKRLINRKKEDR
jgi:hypothetical protein